MVGVLELFKFDTVEVYLINYWPSELERIINVPRQARQNSEIKAYSRNLSCDFFIGKWESKFSEDLPHQLFPFPVLKNEKNFREVRMLFHIENSL